MKNRGWWVVEFVGLLVLLILLGAVSAGIALNALGALLR